MGLAIQIDQILIIVARMALISKYKLISMTSDHISDWPLPLSKVTSVAPKLFTK